MEFVKRGSGNVWRSRFEGEKWRLVAPCVRGLGTLLAAVLISSSAMAAGITWQLGTVTFAGDGATASGSMVYNAATRSVSSINFVTTAGQAFGAHTFTNAVSHAENDGVTIFSPSTSASDLTGTPILVLKLVDKTSPLTNSGGRVAVNVSEGTCGDAACDMPSGVFLTTAGTITASSSSDCVQPTQFALTPGGQAFSAAPTPGPYAINVSDTFGCGWTVAGVPAWLTGVTVNGTGALSGVGNDTVSYAVLPNPGSSRSATLTIADLPFRVEEAANSIQGLTFAGTLPQIASAGTWATTITHINLGATAATTRSTFFADDGTPLPLPLTFPQSTTPSSGPLLASVLDRTLNPNGMRVMSSTGPDSQPELSGWGNLSATGSVGGFAIFSNPDYNWSAVVPLESRDAPVYLLAFDNTGKLNTGVALANRATQTSGVRVVIRDDTGAQIGTDTINLPAQGHTSFLLKDNYPSTIGKRGTVEFDRPMTGSISVLGLRVNGTSLTTLPVLASVDTTGGVIAHATYNGGFTTLFTLVNTGNATAQATLNFFDENGSPLVVPLSLPQTSTTLTSSTLTRTLAAGASLLVQTQAQDALAAVAGSAQLTATGNVSGFAIFDWTTNGQEASVPLQTGSPNGYVLGFDNTNGIYTGVALANVSNQSANVPVIIRDDTGTQLIATQIVLPPNGHTSFGLADYYPVAASIRGTVEFDKPAGGRISVIGLRAKDTTLTTIPALSK